MAYAFSPDNKLVGHRRIGRNDPHLEPGQWRICAGDGRTQQLCLRPVVVARRQLAGFGRRWDGQCACGMPAMACR